MYFQLLKNKLKLKLTWPTPPPNEVDLHITAPPAPTFTNDDLPYLFERDVSSPWSPEQVTSFWLWPLRSHPVFLVPAGFRFTPSISSERVKEETAEGNSWEADEVGKWVRGLRPKRRQLPLPHPGLLLGSLPRCPSPQSRQLVRDLWEGRALAQPFFFLPLMLAM